MVKGEIVTMPLGKMDLEYDKRADVLYIQFSPETTADDSELTDNDIIIRYKNKKIVGLTVLHFSERQKVRKTKTKLNQA
jgi:uncharacterized protein YuzE